MYDLARSCHKLQRKSLIFATEKSHKKAIRTKKPLRKCKKYLEACPEINFQEVRDLLTVPDNSRSYQGFQEVTKTCKKIQDLRKSFNIFTLDPSFGLFFSADQHMFI